MHFERTPYAYQGFAPWSSITPPVLKPGETLESRAQKFKGVGSEVIKGSYLTSEREMRTNTQMSYDKVEPEDFQVPDRRGVSKHWATSGVDERRRKKFIATTTYRASFHDPQAEHQKQGEPEWLVASKKIPKEPLPRAGTLSTYQKDYGTAGHNPSDRPYMEKNGMAGTTKDLFAGTTKVTHHIPGYSGVIPENQRNPSIVKHSDAAETRQEPSNLRLFHKHNMSGYTGHKPTHASNDKGMRLTGANLLTSSGASAAGHML